MTMGRIIGIILMIAGLVICGACAGLSFIGNQAATGGVALSNEGAFLGFILLGITPLLILGGIGVFLFVRGGQEAVEMADVRKKERLLGMIQAAGKVSIGSAAVELKMTRDQIKEAILDLVNQGLFSGYVNWQELTFYSKDLSQVQSTKCANCGGQREAVGKGVVKCPYCGVELFLPQS